MRNSRGLMPKVTSCLALLGGLSLVACMTKDKQGQGQRVAPPWDNGQETLLQLEGYARSGSDTLFQIFKTIESIDSAAGPRQQWQYEPGSPDTLRVQHLVDTNFVFPDQAADVYAYAYDETYRDDTLFRLAYGNGLYTEEHPCAEVWIITTPFIHPVRWLKAGMSEQDIEGTMGRPSLRHPGALRYLYRDDPEVDIAGGGDKIPREQRVEGVHFYFQQDSLFAAVFQRSRPCH